METKKIREGERVKKIPIEVQEVGRRKLRMLNNSNSLTDLRALSSKRLEKLSGDLKEYHSIHINDQWRIIFKWGNSNCLEVQILDYH